MAADSKDAGESAKPGKDSLTPAQREAAQSQRPSPEQRREGLTPDELNTSNDK